MDGPLAPCMAATYRTNLTQPFAASFTMLREFREVGVGVVEYWR